jgi:hypothetical protein
MSHSTPTPPGTKAGRSDVTAPTTATGSELSPPRGLRRAIVLAVPPTFAALTLLHPEQDPHQLGGDVTQWLLVHTAQLVLTVLLAYALWFLLEGLAGWGARLARAALPVFLVFFSAFDAVAGLATGWLEHDAHHHDATEQVTIRGAIDELFNGNWLTGNLSIAGGTSAVAWLAVTIGAAIAMHQAGATRLTVTAMALASLFANHPPPLGTAGLLALSVAAYTRDRQLHRHQAEAGIAATVGRGERR